MDRQTLYSRRFGSLPSWMAWPGTGLAAVIVMLVIEYFETPTLIASIQFEELFVFKLLGYANLLLIASTVLYVCHLWFTSETVGRWASRLAGFGALASLIALSTRWFETYYLYRPGHFSLSSMYEIVALFSAITVVIYLVMERVYRTRAAGAFVMLIVFAAVLFQVWLAAHDQAIPGSRIRVLKSYWMHAHVLGNFIGYGAFAVAAAMGVAFLLRTRPDGVERHHFALASLPDADRIDTLMHNAIAFGFPVFTLATGLGALWAFEAWGRYWAWDPKETWALMVWLTYASYFYFRFVNRWTGRHMAWWSIIGFAITIFCFLGVNALLPSLHSAMPVAFQQAPVDVDHVSHQGILLQDFPGLCHDQSADLVAA